jgi:MFS family permease
VIGDVLAIAIAGTLLGPAVGVLAHAIGTKPVFSSVVVVAAILSVLALRLPIPGHGDPVGVRETADAIRRRPVLQATGLVMAPSVFFGVIAVLVPLRINSLGGGPGIVAAGFMAGAAFEAVLSAWVGRVSDRVGRLRPYVIGMAISAAGLAVLPASHALGVVLTLLVVMSIGAGLCFTPALALLSDAAEASGLHQGLAAGLINVAWAAGQVLGSVGAGATASAAGDALPCLVVAGMLLVVAFAARQNGIGRARYVAHT